jgi:methyl-accepting chemotaxis protein
MKRAISTEIWILVMLFISACLIIAGIGIYQISEVKGVTHYLVKDKGQKLELAHSLENNFYAQLINEKMLDDVKTREDADEVIKNGEKLKMANDQIFNKYYLIASDKGKIDLNNYKIIYTEWFNRFNEEKKLVLDPSQKNKLDLLIYQNDLERFKVDEIIDGIVLRNSKDLNSEYTKNEEHIKNVIWIFISLSFFVIVSGFTFSFFTIKKLKLNINRIIGNLLDSSHTVKNTTDYISDSSQKLSAASNQQASSLQQTSSSLEELNAMVKNNADQSVNAQEKSFEGHNIATEGKALLEQMVKIIEDLNNSNKNLMKVIDSNNSKFNDSVLTITKIADQTKVINDIVFQTKLLSFNASVEAARAGDMGKGFSVVAEEMNKLALISGVASKDIESQLNTGIKEVNGILSNTQSELNSVLTEFEAKIVMSVDLTEKCRNLFDSIYDNAAEIKNLSNELSHSCKEEANGIDEINKAVSQLDLVTKINAEASEEAAFSALNLKEQAIALDRSIKELAELLKGTDKKEIGVRNNTHEKAAFHGKFKEVIV